MFNEKRHKKRISPEELREQAEKIINDQNQYHSNINQNIKQIETYMTKTKNTLLSNRQKLGQLNLGNTYTEQYYRNIHETLDKLCDFSQLTPTP